MLELILVLNATLPEDNPLALVEVPAVVAHPEKASAGIRSAKIKAKILIFLLVKNINSPPFLKINFIFYYINCHNFKNNVF
jgi:hypothetical protein